MTGALLIDLYETLVRAGPGGQHLGERLGLPDAYAEVWATGRPWRMKTMATFEDVALRIYEVAGVEPDRALVAQVVAERLSAKRALLRELDPRIESMLTAVDVPCVVLSNCSSDEVVSWPGSRLSELVTTAIFSCEVGLAKPEPAIYAAALDAVGCEPADAVFVGDGGSDELTGAAAAGIGRVLRGRRGSSTGSRTPLVGPSKGHRPLRRSRPWRSPTICSRCCATADRR